MGGGGLELWDLRASKLVATYPTTAAQGVQSVAISPEGKTLIAGGYAGGTAQQVNDIGILEIWSIASGKLVNSLPTATSQIRSIAISPNGKYLADTGYPPLTALKQGIELWSLPSGKAVGLLDSTTAAPSTVCFSPNGRDLLVGCGSATIETWKLSSLELSSTLHTAAFQNCQSLKFSPDSKALAVGGHSRGNAITLMNSRTGRVERTLATKGNSIPSISFSPDNRTIAGCGTMGYPAAGFLDVWDYGTGKLRQSLPTAATDLSETEFSPDGKTLADVGYGVNGGVVEIWNVATKTPVRSFPTTANRNLSVGFSPDGKLIASGGEVWDPKTYLESGSVEVWNVSTGSLVVSLPTSVLAVGRVTFSPDGKQLLVGGTHQTTNSLVEAVVEVWNVAKGTLERTLSLTPRTQYLYSACFTRDGKTIFVGTDLDLEAFSASTFKQLATYSDGGVNALAISPNGSSMALNSLYGWLGVCPTPALK